MNEQVFEVQVKGDALYGIWHHPESDKKTQTENVGVVFLHGWSGHRPGPHDMLVKMARCLASDGYHCFRFDFRGKGYSQGDRMDTNNYSMMEDLDAVLQFVNSSLDHPEIVLIGICSGAKLALYYARNGNHSIAHVIELSSPVLRQQEVNSALAVNQVKHTINEYLNKVFNRETWSRLIKGEIYFFAVWRNVLKPISRLSTGKRKIANPKTHKSKSNKKPFGKFKGHMLLIHGEKDPETIPALKQIHEMLYNYEIPLDTYVVKDANHSFYSLAWKNEIIFIVRNWLNNKLFRLQKN